MSEFENNNEQNINRKKFIETKKSSMRNFGNVSSRSISILNDKAICGCESTLELLSIYDAKRKDKLYERVELDESLRELVTKEELKLSKIELKHVKAALVVIIKTKLKRGQTNAEMFERWRIDRAVLPKYCERRVLFDMALFYGIKKNEISFTISFTRRFIHSENNEPLIKYRI